MKFAFLHVFAFPPVSSINDLKYCKYAVDLGKMSVTSNLKHRNK